MKILLITLSILIPCIILGQTNNKGTFKVRKQKEATETESNSNENANLLETYPANVEIPTFPGGEEALKQFIEDNLIYPAEAKKIGISGTVYVKFAVLKDGSLKDIKITERKNRYLDEEAIRIVKLMPKWNPGKLSGKVADFNETIPIVFKRK